MKNKKITVIVGHYGSGKTNISANLALRLSEKGTVSIIDLDIVNPYFRTADLSGFFSDKNIKLISPKLVGKALDVPALNFSLSADTDYTIIDVGGDDEGAKALGRYTGFFENQDIDNIDMFCVVNKYRYLTQEADEALELLRKIELASGLKCTGIINNSHLGAETTPEIIKASLPYAKKIAEEAGVPLIFTAGLDFPAEIIVKPIWVN